MNDFISLTSVLGLFQAIPFSFAALFPVLNPFGSAVIFLAMTLGASQQELNTLSLKIAINTFILLVVVLLTGSWILRFFGITVPIVQIGGGLVVAYIGWTMLNQSNHKDSNQVAAQSNDKDIDKNVKDMAFFPLTMPITAGPGCIAVTLTIGAHEMQHSLSATAFNLLGAIIGIALSAVVVFVCYRYTNRLTQRLSAAGIQVIMRLSAFINLCIGLAIIWHGVQGLGLS